MDLYMEYEKDYSDLATPMTSSSYDDYLEKTTMATNTSESALSVLGFDFQPSVPQTNNPLEKIQHNGLKRMASQAFYSDNTQDVSGMTNENHNQNLLQPHTYSTMPFMKPIENNTNDFNVTKNSVALREDNFNRIQKKAEDTSLALSFEQQYQVKRQRVVSTSQQLTGNTDALQHQLLDPTATAESSGVPIPLVPTATPPLESRVDEKPEGKDKKLKKEKLQSCSCNFIDPEKKTACKQRSILRFKYCIRHILCDATAPYKRCQYIKVVSNKPDDPGKECTNAIPKETTEIYCTTHLIMMGVKQPKKKKKKFSADDCTVSISGSEQYLNDIITNGFNQYFDESSLPSFPDKDNGCIYIGNSGSTTTGINGFDQPQSQTSTTEHWVPTPHSHGYNNNNGYHMMDAAPLDMGYNPPQSEPSTVYYGNMEPMMPMQVPPQQQQQTHQPPQMHVQQQQQQQNIVYHPPSTTIQQEFSRYEGPVQQTQMLPPPIPPPLPPVKLSLVQNANGHHILVDENGVEQPKDSYSLYQNPDGSLVAKFNSLDHCQEKLTPDNGFPLSIPPESSPPLFAEDPRRQLYHSQSLDGTNTFDPQSFPQSHVRSVTPTPPPQSVPSRFGDISRQHPQLLARLMQPSSMNNQQHHRQQNLSQINNNPYMEPAPITGPPAQHYLQQPSYDTQKKSSYQFVYTDPVSNSEIMPPSMPCSTSTQSASTNLYPNYVTLTHGQICSIVTYETGESHLLPEKAQIIENSDGITTIVMPPDSVVPPGIPVKVTKVKVVIS